VNLNDSLTITAKIKNTGSREGMEVVQLYIRKEYSSVVRPVKELKAFKKVSVQPGEVKQVEMTLKISECGYYNNLGEYILEPGIINIMIGSSSEDIHLTAKVNLEAI
jgi:beta-glucosidase